MKKMLRKIAVLICAAILLILPASSASAATDQTPFIASNYNGTKTYQYPTPVVLQPGEGFTIRTETGWHEWGVPSGKFFSITIWSTDMTPITGYIYRINAITGLNDLSIVQENVSNVGGGFVPVNHDTRFYIAIENTSNKPIQLDSFIVSTDY